MATTISSLPSPSRSPYSTLLGDTAVVKSTLVENEDAIMDPEVLTFLNAEKVALFPLETKISDLPSISASARLT